MKKKTDVKMLKPSPVNSNKTNFSKKSKHSVKEKIFVKDTILNSTIVPQQTPILQKSDISHENKTKLQLKKDKTGLNLISKSHIARG